MKVVLINDVQFVVYALPNLSPEKVSINSKYVMLEMCYLSFGLFNWIISVVYFDYPFQL